MIVTWKRVQVLVLLVCGLMTAPFGSLEQFEATDSQTATMPCLSGGATPLPLYAPRSDVSIHTFAMHLEWCPTILQTEWQRSTAVVPPESAHNLTYHANAPPSHLI